MKRSWSQEQFEELVGLALEDLPQTLSRHMSNVGIFVEEDPPPEVLDEEEDGSNLLGLYEGVPLTERDSDYWGVLPDRITLFKRNLENAAEGAEDLKELVRETVIHEVAHHFGIDDDRLDELGWS